MPESQDIHTLAACHDCGQVNRILKRSPKTKVLCLRCGSKLFGSPEDTTDRTLALAMTSLVLFFIANCYPFLAIRFKGLVQETNLITGIITLFQQGMPGLSLVVLLTTLILPLFQILGLIYIYLPMKMGVVPWQAARVFRSIRFIQPWGMMEVYMLAILVSMIKLAKLATILPGIASGAFMILICVLAATLSGLNPDDVWKRLPVTGHGYRGKKKYNKRFPVGCHSCSLICLMSDEKVPQFCPRCQARLHIRKSGSLNRTWALVIAAAILYFPANIFPVTLTRTLVIDKADTILSGVIYFLFSGSWHIALVIFVASVLVPLAKLIILVYLLISVHFKSTWKPEDRTRLYRLTEVIGRWSMVDVYVVTILVSLVRLGSMANITAGPGAVYFSAVVIITMLAARSFDPRLIWDVMEESDEQK